LVAAEQSVVHLAMSDDALKRARQALATVNGQRTQPATLDPAKVDDLLTRARAAANTSKAAPPPVQQAAAPRVEKVRLQMTCSATGRSFVAIAERRGDELLRVGNEAPQPGRGGSAPAEMLSGAYHVANADSWACPHCSSRDASWSCDCAQSPDALHCGGKRGRRRYCACGRLEDRHFVEVESIQVRGQSIAATPSRSSPGRSGGPSNVPAIRGR
jgi:hypothetical protein